MTIYLYVKTHRKTGLKYLGKTESKDPHKYHGSGKYWSSHIKTHGYDVTTEILRECQSNEEVREWGLYYSELWQVVESDNWANLKEEAGDGCTSEQAREIAINRVKDGTNPLLGGEIQKQEALKRLADGTHHLLGGKIQKQTALKRVADGTHNFIGGKIASQTNLKRVADGTHHFLSPTLWTCPHCCKSGKGIGMFTRWHGDNCKKK